jgi:ABC-type Zn uptake system ZnuABC Zn-binding protein ZnuA/ABC-type Mn2+/Zn2+ transport system permease subunit
VADIFQLPFVQRGVVEVVVLAVGAGVIGTWIVLRGLAFYSHAIGTAAFPGLVLADGLGFSAHLGAAGAAAIVTLALAWLGRRDRDRYDSLTALVLVGMLALGVILASDVFHSGANVETLLFGSLLLIGHSDIAWAAGASGLALVVAALAGHRWLAVGFDEGSARSLGVRGALPDAALLAAVAVVAVAALSAVGALLATALMVVPAATTRLVCERIGPWQLATVALTAVEGVVGLWLSVELNAPPGATIAVLAGGLFAAVALARVLVRNPRRRAALAPAAALLALVLLAGCDSAQKSDAAPGAPGVVATTTQLGDVTRAVGGDAAQVTQILRPNTDPHDYEPRPADVRDTADAKVVFESGDGLDRWIGKVVGQSGGHPARVDLARHIPYRVGTDPHWWHDPRNVEAAVGVIQRALTRAHPSTRATYARNARAYVRRLRALDAGIAECFARVPAAERKLVTDHDAFGYFARRYGIRVIGAVIPSQTTQAQSSAADASALSRLVRRERVKAIFPESSINPKLADAIARQTGASARYELYGDTLGPGSSRGATYLGMEEANADAMVRGFTGGAQRCRVAGP